MPYFFFSYARQDTDNLLDDFYEDLCKEIRRLSPETDEPVGFRYTETRLGENWPYAVAKALQDCRVLVCLYSNAYFACDKCGREWHIFEKRLQLYIEQNNGLSNVQPPPVIKPVIWFEPNSIPQVARDTQYKSGSPEKYYNKESLLHLLQQHGKNAEYWDYIAKLAEEIVSDGKQYIIPQLPKFPSFHETPNAFKTNGPNSSEAVFSEPAYTVQPPVQLPKPSLRLGPKYIHFVYIAGAPNEVRTIRSEIRPYLNNGGADWQPYFPQNRTRIGPYSQNIVSASRMRCMSLPLDFSDSLEIEIRKIEEMQNIVIIFVDSWTLKLDKYKSVLERLDKLEYYNCAILVPWYEDGPENKENEEQLQKLLQSTFKRKYSRDNNHFQNGIPTLRDLGERLKQVVRLLQTKYVMNIDDDKGGGGFPKPTL